MKRVWNAVVVLAVVAVGGCQPEQPDHIALVQQALRALLKDPESARFQNIRIVNGRVCGEYNAKNSYGGYVGFEPFYGHVDDMGKVEAFSSSTNSFGSDFAKVLETACADASHMTLDERTADLKRRLVEQDAYLRQVQTERSQSAPR